MKRTFASEILKIAKDLVSFQDEFKKNGVTIQHAGRQLRNLENQAEGFGHAVGDVFDVTLSSGEKHKIKWTTHGQGGYVKLDDKPGALVAVKGKAYRWQTKNLDKPMQEWVQENFDEPDELAVAIELIGQYYDQFR